MTRLIAASAFALTLSMASTGVAQEELVGTWEQVVGLGEGFEGNLRLTLAADHTFEIVVIAEFKPELLEVDAGSFGVDEDGSRAAPAVPTRDEGEEFDAPPPPAETPTDEAPPGETATDVAPPRETPTDVAPPGETPSAEGPGEETPATEPPPAETPTDEAPPGETATDVAPGKETPVNDEPRGEDFELGEELFYFALYAEGFELEIVARGSWEAEDELLTLRFEAVEIGIDGGTVSEFLEASARDLAALLAREQGIDDDEYADFELAIVTLFELQVDSGDFERDFGHAFEGDEVSGFRTDGNSLHLLENGAVNSQFTRVVESVISPASWGQLKAATLR